MGMNPCVGCKRKGNCPEKCYPKADYERHMAKLNRKIRQKQGKKVGLALQMSKCSSES